MTELPTPRDDLAGLAAYRTQQAAAEVRLHANEWAVPNPASAWLTPQELNELLLNRYPAPASELRRGLAERYGVAADQIVLGNGSNEVLLNTFLIFGGHGRSALLFQPTYSMHRRLAITAGSRVIDEFVGLPYDLGRERALSAVERHQPDVIAFTTPNNPTGNEIAPDVILAVAAARPRALILVDEAYSDFSGHTLVPKIATQPNIVVSKTFSKVRAAAGLRLGVLVANLELAAHYRAVQLPYNINVITSAVAAKIVKDDAAISRRVAQCASERSRLSEALRRVNTIDVFPSVTNFVLFRMKDRDAASAHARFLAQGVLIRDISNWPGCEGCLRVSVGTPDETDRFIGAIPRALAG